MSGNIATEDLRTLGYVLRRVNYGETDRILTLITPHGKLSAIAKAARKEKSKLAGGIEMFTLSDFNLHFGRHNLAIITSARMKKFHHGIIKELARVELASDFIKQINVAAMEGYNNHTEPYFTILDQSFAALGEGEDLDLVKIWFVVNLKKITGEEINLYRDQTGAKLAADQTYRWDTYERIFVPDATGDCNASHIKLLRLMAGGNLDLVRRVKIDEQILAVLRNLAKVL